MDLIIRIALEFWNMLCGMAPYLLAGFLVAGLLSVFVSARQVERHLGGRGVKPVMKAALLGVPLPLCSCAVIPVAVSLRRHGASKGATTSFLISTPQTGVDSIMPTLALLGPVIAIFRPVAAWITGVIGGMAVDLLDKKESVSEGKVVADDYSVPTPGRNRWAGALRHAFVVLPRDIAVPFLIGLLVAGAISALVPVDFFSKTLGVGIMPILIMMVVSIPLYVCATGSVPIAAAMIGKGITPGAALAFLIAGPATNSATIAIIWKVMGRRTAVIYLVVVALASVLSGLLMDYVFLASSIPLQTGGMLMLPQGVKVASALILLALMAVALLKAKRSSAPIDAALKAENRATLSIEGMTCENCAERVEQALKTCRGVKRAVINRRKGTATVYGRDFDMDLLRSAVERAGYKVVG